CSGPPRAVPGPGHPWSRRRRRGTGGASSEILVSGCSFPDLPRVAERAEQGEDQPAREVARDVVDIDAGDYLHEVVADDAPLALHPSVEVGHLLLGHAALCGAGLARGDGGIEAVGIDGDVVALGGRDASEDLVDAHPVQLLRAHEDAAVLAGGVELLLAGAAEAAEADLGHAGEPGHLGGPAQRAAQAVLDPVALVPPRAMGS